MRLRLRFSVVCYEVTQKNTPDAMLCSVFFFDDTSGRVLMSAFFFFFESCLSFFRNSKDRKRKWLRKERE